MWKTLKIIFRKIFYFLKRVNTYLDDSPYKNIGSNKVKKEYINKSIHEEITSSCIEYLYKKSWNGINLPYKFYNKNTIIIIKNQFFNSYYIEIVFLKHNDILVIRELIKNPYETLEESIINYINKNKV